MNGFSENDANWGIGSFIIIALISGILTAILSFIVCKFGQNKWQWNAIISALVSIVVFSIINGVINFAGVFIAVIIAEIKRKGGI